MVPYAALVGSGTTPAERFVEVVESRLRSILRIALQHVDVDEEWYRQRYRDVDAAILSGQVESAREHYILYGYFEDRLPRPALVDENWYLGNYRDVAEATDHRVFATGQQHFEAEGFKEGRLPHDGWSL